MQYGLIHYNAPGATAAEFLRWAGDNGFDCTELQFHDVWGPEEEHPERAAEALRRVADDAGIAVAALSVGNDFVVLDPDEVQAQVTRMKRICTLAEILGTKTLRTEGGQPKESVPESRWVEAMAGCIERCLEFAVPAGFRLAVDNHGFITNAPGILPALFRRVPSPNLGTNLDTMNYRWWGNSVADCERIYVEVAPKVFSTHLKDGFGSRQEYRGTALGEGEIPLVYAVRVMREAGYQGPWIAEFEGRTDRADGYRKCLEWMKANII